MRATSIAGARALEGRIGRDSPMMSISPAFGQDLVLPSDQYAGQTPQPWGMAKMSAMNRPRSYAFFVLIRIELRLPPTAMPSELSTAMTTVSSDWT